MTELNDESYHFDKVPQPTWSRADSTNALSPVFEGITYKLTRIGIVVRRGAALFKDRCTTYHDPDKKTDATTWMLDRSCTLLPASPAELASKRRGIRPKGTWAITAVVQGVESHIDLYELTIDWPPSWAAAGYTSLVLGFPERREAEQWHAAVSRVLAELGATRGPARSAATSPGIDLTTTSAPVASAGKTDRPPLRDDANRAVDLEASDANSATGQLAAPARSQSAGPDRPDLSIGGSQRAAVVSTTEGRAPAEPALHRDSLVCPAVAASLAGAHVGWLGPDDDDIPSGSDDDDDDEGDDVDEAGEGGGTQEERWVPYRQTNGVAIYYHAAEGKKAGGEYMVSCVIRGRPGRVAAALMRLRGNTTILGPVAHAEVLQPAGGSGGDGKEVLRLVLTASGYAGYICAPREIILERMRKEEDDGVIVILFKSVDLPNEASSKGSKTNQYGSGLYKRPVRGTVAGGYTIAGLRGEGSASPESLVTCIVKADLGGVCGSSSWARPLASMAGWTDAFLERILMSVHLLRDEVEQRRFSVQPFKLVASAKARFNEDGAVMGNASAAKDMAAAAGGGVTSFGSGSVASGAISRRQSIVSVRPAARMASHRLSSVITVPASTQAAVAAAPAIPEDGVSQAEVDAASFHLDINRVRTLALMPRKYWAEVQVPGTDAPFSVRGPTYLKDKKKVLAGPPAFQLGSLDMVVLPPPGSPVADGVSGLTGVVEHVARFIPSIRQGGAPFSIIINLVVPGSPMLSMIAVFCCDKHPSILGTPPARPMDEPHDWQPFDFVLHKFVYGSDETRNKMLKLIPHIASGSWMIKQSVGTTPAIMGKALKTTYHCTPTYIEVDVDIAANSVANYVTGMVRGATSSLVIDLAFVLEGTAPWELPECLLGAFRLMKLDCKDAAAPIDWSKELPLTAGAAAGSSKL